MNCLYTLRLRYYVTALSQEICVIVRYFGKLLLKTILSLQSHSRTGRCGVLAIATWAAWFWAAQGRLLTKEKEERGKKREKRKKEERKKERKKGERKEKEKEREEDLRPIWVGYSVFRLCTSLYARLLILQLGNRPQVGLHITDIGP